MLPSNLAQTLKPRSFLGTMDFDELKNLILCKDKENTLLTETNEVLRDQIASLQKFVFKLEGDISKLASPAHNKSATNHPEAVFKEIADRADKGAMQQLSENDFDCEQNPLTFVRKLK